MLCIHKKECIIAQALRLCVSSTGLLLMDMYRGTVRKLLALGHQQQQQQQQQVLLMPVVLLQHSEIADGLQ